MRPVGRGEPLGTVFRSVGRAQHYHMDPRPPDPRLVRLYISLSRVSLAVPYHALSACLCPSLNPETLLGFVYWRHKSGRNRWAAILSKQAVKRNRPLKRLAFLLIFGLLLARCFSHSDMMQYSLEIRVPSLIYDSILVLSLSFFFLFFSAFLPFSLAEPTLVPSVPLLLLHSHLTREPYG